MEGETDHDDSKVGLIATPHEVLVGPPAQDSPGPKISVEGKALGSRSRIQSNVTHILIP